MAHICGQLKSTPSLTYESLNIKANILKQQCQLLS